MAAMNAQPNQMRVNGRHEQLSQMVARTVREAIMAGELKAPSFIRTERLAEDLGVSPTPVREALMILHTEGAVRWEPRKGYRIAPITHRDVVDLFEVQAHIAGELAARAALTLSDDDMDRLEQVQVELEGAAAVSDIERVDRLNHGVHRTINSASGSTRLTSLLQQTVQYVPLGFFGRIDGWADASSHEHSGIFAALRASDSEAARASMSEHIIHIGSLLLNYLDLRGSLQEEPPVAGS